MTGYSKNNGRRLSVDGKLGRFIRVSVGGLDMGLSLSYDVGLPNLIGKLMALTKMGWY